MPVNVTNTKEARIAIAFLQEKNKQKTTKIVPFSERWLYCLGKADRHTMRKYKDKTICKIK